jgi:UDP-N-acetylglucosamine 2-epimerase (non-hydrolysing)
VAVRVLLAFGTRPEAIKLAPVVEALRADRRFSPILAATAQHRGLLDQALGLFGLVPDYDLDLMRPGQDLTHVTTAVLEGLKPILEEAQPDLVVVQGDTTTTFAGALAAFYARIPVAHVEAGLRTGDPFSPYPEETNRTLTAHLADFHFAPTGLARENLLAEGIAPAAIHVTGNTGIDALLQIARRVRDDMPVVPQELATLDPARPLVLVTAHRRESFGGGLENICRAIAELATTRPDIDLVFPVHPNPNVRRPVNAMLGTLANVRVVEPVDYEQLVWLLSRSTLVLTDSGGIQEEAPSLNVPALVLRDKTERPEGVDAGALKLVGTDPARIVAEALRLLDDPAEHARMAAVPNPYGDGHAAKRIVSTLAAKLGREVAA